MKNKLKCFINRNIDKFLTKISRDTQFVNRMPVLHMDEVKCPTNIKINQYVQCNNCYIIRESDTRWVIYDSGYGLLHNESDIKEFFNN